MNEYYLYTFESTHAAIATEKLLKPAECRIMPVPRFISASCGISVRIKPEKKPQADELFVQSTLSPGEYSYYHINKDAATDEIICDKLI